MEEEGIDKIYNAVNAFKPISLKEMDAVSLMKRTDTKFVVPLSKLAAILNSVNDSYRVLEINGARVMTYSSLYFDTEGRSFYNDHHNGRTNRTKIRIRNYVESKLFFLEIKQKNHKGVTNKSRIPLDGFEEKLSGQSMEYIQEVTSKKYALTPTLLNNFRRITLVNIEDQERVTLDIGLSFTKEGNHKSWEDMVIVELKQERFNRNSGIVQSLSAFGYRRFSISKYCIGMVSLNADLKYNAFKGKIRRINKLLAA